MVSVGDAAMKERIDSERNQGRAPDMGWLDHDRLGFNYRLTDIACALGHGQLARLDGMLPTARAWPAGTARRWRASRGSGCRARTPVAIRRGWFVFVVQVPRGRDRDEVIHALRLRGVQCKPYLPAIHLMTSTASASATARASSRSARTSPRARSRCRSSRP
jgi:perosamine synthetase